MKQILMKKFSIIFIIILIFLLFFLFLHKNMGENNKLITTTSKYIPIEVKRFLKNTIFIFKQNELDKNLIKQKQSTIEYLNLKINTVLSDHFRDIYDEALNLGYIPVNKLNDDEIININGSNFLFEKFRTFLINTSKFPSSKSNSYIELYNDELILVSAHGIFAHTKITNFNNDQLELDIIKSNITEIVKYEDFYLPSQFGIKDTLIVNNLLFISLVNEMTPNSRCFNTSVFVANIDLQELRFKKLFEPNECINENNEFPNTFGAHNSGGRMFMAKDNILLMTTGEYEYMTKSQDLESVFGKLISIQIDIEQISKSSFEEIHKYEIVASGLRNPQGLYYSNVTDRIYLTDHGPEGGDEINMLEYKSDQNNVYNFGWPISSYGNHYNYLKGVSKELNNLAPLYKSHSNYNFIEPIKVFTPSIGISQIIEVDHNFMSPLSESTIIASSLGNQVQEGDMSLHIIDFDKDFNIERISIEPLLGFSGEAERIRDISYYKNRNQIFLFLETTGSIGILSAETK